VPLVSWRAYDFAGFPPQNLRAIRATLHIMQIGHQTMDGFLPRFGHLGMVKEHNTQP
jgi:hypothetical protein